MHSLVLLVLIALLYCDTRLSHSVLTLLVVVLNLLIDNSHISHTSTNAHNLHFTGNKNGNGQILGDALVCRTNTNNKMDTSGSVFRGNKNKTGIKLGQSPEVRLMAIILLIQVGMACMMWNAMLLSV